jgi:hypothetical protein
MSARSCERPDARLFSHRHGIERRPELCERTPHTLSVVTRRFDPYVQILRRAYVPVRSECMRANDNVLNVVSVEGAQ